MKFYEELFLSDKMKLSKQEIMDKITNGEVLFHTYLIVVPLIEVGNQLEYFHVEIHNQACFQSDDYLVVGIAFGKHDAFVIVNQMIARIYEETKDVEIRQYFMSKL